MQPEFLTIEDVLGLHCQQIELFGGSQGLGDMGLLQSALAQPEATFGEQYLHSDLFEMAAAYLFHLVNNHPFVDGNKRIGLDAALVFLDINKVSLVAKSAEFVSLTLQTAQGQVKKPEIAEFFRQHVVPKT